MLSQRFMTSNPNASFTVENSTRPEIPLDVDAADVQLLHVFAAVQCQNDATAAGLQSPSTFRALQRSELTAEVRAELPHRAVALEHERMPGAGGDRHHSGQAWNRGGLR
jgi:hypothetical protein